MEEMGYRQLISDLIEAPEKEYILQEGKKRSDEPEIDAVKPETSQPPSPSTTDSREKIGLGKDKQREKNETKKRIETLHLRKEEERFIDALFPFIRTPRMAKRFINIYRLLRVRASMPDMDFLKFSDPQAGEYRAVLTLLAINVGYPDVAPKIFKNLIAENSGNFQIWLNSLSTKNKGENEKEYFYETVSMICKELELVKTALKDIDGPSFDERLETYIKWVQEVGRYSFYSCLSEDL
jgi:hypothetical protein